MIESVTGEVELMISSCHAAIEAVEIEVGTGDQRSDLGGMRFDISSVRGTDRHLAAAVNTVDGKSGLAGGQFYEISISIHGRKGTYCGQRISFLADKNNYTRLIEDGKEGL